MQNLILIQLDGLRYTTARQCLGWPEAMVRAGKAQVFPITAELPSLSRPLYETLLTGRTPVEHGVVSNETCRRSRCESLFDRVRAAGGRTAAAAYHWIAELYLEAPFNPRSNRLLLDGDGAITDGVFYWDGVYPDSHVFADAQVLIDRGADFLLLHPMNADEAGHRAGGSSQAYRTAARRQGDLLAQYAPNWIEAGYRLIVTADHGMSDDGNHSGPAQEEVLTPFYLFGASIDRNPAQTEIAGLCCALMEIPRGGIPPYRGKLR